MQRLTKQNYWESHNRTTDAAASAPGSQAVPAARRSWLRRLVTIPPMYSEHHFWELLLPRYLSPAPGKTVIEIGSAPGTHQVEFHRHFAYTPYGVEYTSSGAEVNRDTYRSNGLNPDNVLHADFFSAEFQTQWAAHFDAVLSRGFIEHFDDPRSVIARHVDLIRPGGHLVVNIPNLQGMHLFMVRKFVPELVPLHNLNLMNLPAFAAAFEDPRLETLFCGYAGGFHLLMADATEGALPPRLLNVLRKGQVLLNIAQSAIGSFESRNTSPYLTYVGRRRAGS
jgi:2-polyprenyl-3-methyl-5-hydroxy-6-metoxy-1,4-benzoquinol methylase